VIFAEVLDRARDSLGLLTSDARVDAETVLGICADIESGKPSPEARRQLLAAVELLARRRSQAIPFATLGRAALAELAGAPRDREQLVLETSRNLSLLGL